MSSRLRIIIIITMICFLIYIFKHIKRLNISTKHALIWIIADILVIISTIFVEQLFDFIKVIGIENVSSMMFFLGFILLIIVCFNLSNYISVQTKKINSLTQELGILKNQINKGKNEKVIK